MTARNEEPTDADEYARSARAAAAAGREDSAAMFYGLAADAQRDEDHTDQTDRSRNTSRRG